MHQRATPVERATFEHAGHWPMPQQQRTGETMTEQAEKSELILLKNGRYCALVYFDISPTHGILGGAIQVNCAPAF